MSTVVWWDSFTCYRWYWWGGVFSIVAGTWCGREAPCCHRSSSLWQTRRTHVHVRHRCSQYRDSCQRSAQALAFLVALQYIPRENVPCNLDNEAILLFFSICSFGAGAHGDRTLEDFWNCSSRQRYWLFALLYRLNVVVILVSLDVVCCCRISNH